MIYLGDTMSFVISKIKEFINSMIAILVSILLLVFMIVSIPFDYIKYKFSLFYKNEKIPYFITWEFGARLNIYNTIYNNHLPIKYIRFSNAKNILDGCFIYKNTLIIINFEAIEYNKEEVKWYIDYEDEDANIDSISIDDFIKLELEEVNGKFDKIQCHEAVILADVACVFNYENFVLDERILIYNENNLLDVLKTFISK